MAGRPIPQDAVICRLCGKTRPPLWSQTCPGCGYRNRVAVMDREAEIRIAKGPVDSMTDRQVLTLRARNRRALGDLRQAVRIEREIRGVGGES